MKKKYSLYLILGLVFGLFILPGVFDWLGLPSPSRGISNLLAVVFGKPNGFNVVLAILASGVFIVLIMLGTIKLVNSLEKYS